MRLFLILVSVLISIILCSSSGSAAGSLSDWIEWQVSLNLQVQASQLQLAEIEKKALSTYKWEAPFVHFSTGSSEKTSISGSLYDLEISQALPILGKQKLNLEIFNTELEQANLKHELLKKKVSAQLLSVLFEKKILDKKYSFAVKRNQRLILIDAYLHSRPAVSPELKAQLLIVKQQIKRIESEISQIQSEKQKLNQKMILYQIKEPLPELSWLEGKKDLRTSFLITENIRDHYEIQFLQKNVQKLTQQKRLVALEGWGDPILKGAVDTLGNPLNERTFTLGVGMGVPVWGGNAAWVESLEKRIEKETLDIEYQKNLLANELNEALIQYQYAREQVSKYSLIESEQLIDKLNQLDIDFKKELIDLLTFMELDKQIAENVTMTFQSQKNLMDALLSISLLIGQSDLSRLVLEQ